MVPPADETPFRAVVEDLTETVCRFRADGTFTFVNDVYCRVFGRTRRQLVGHRWQPRAVADDVPAIEARLRALTPSNPVVVIENRVHVAGGGVRWMQFVNRALYDGDGRLTEIQSVGRDVSDRRCAEEDLEASEERFSAAFRHNGTALAITTMDGRWVDVNEAFCSLLGYSRTELIGKTSAELGIVEPKVRRAILSRERVTGSTEGARVVARDRSGSLHHILASSRPIALAGTLHRITTNVDVTALVRVEEALQRSQALLRQSLESSPDAVFAIDREYRLLVNNERHQRDLVESGGHRLEAGECILSPDYPPRTRAHWRRAYDRALRGEEVRLETTWRGRDGRSRESESHVAPLRDEAGGIVGVLVMVHDVTHRKRAEEELRRSRDAILRTSMDGFGRIDRRGRLVAVNDVLCQMTGFDEAELLQMTASDLNAVESPADTAARLRRVRRRGSERFESRLRRKDGSIFDAELSVQSLPGAGGGHVAFLRDITERKQAARLLQDLSREVLAAREEERRQVAAALHHDLGSLAVGIQVRLDAVEKDVRSGRTHEALEWIGQARETLGGAVARLKEVAVAIRPPELDTIGLPAALRRHFARAGEQQGLRIRFTEKLGRRRIVGGGAACLFRIAQEALTNAVRHGQAREAEVALVARGGAVTLSVRDDGRGFDPAKPPEPGAPRIGLASMREMAALVGGSCSIESRPGRGATVRVRVPLRDDRAAAEGRRKEGPR